MSLNIYVVSQNLKIQYFSMPAIETSILIPGKINFSLKEKLWVKVIII